MSLIGKRKGRPTTKIQFDLILKRFQVFLKRETRLTYDIPVILVDDTDFAKRIAAFGEISKENVIHLSTINRHPMDILRNSLLMSMFTTNNTWRKVLTIRVLMLVVQQKIRQMQKQVN
jgi:hypothetical protein